MGNEILKQKRKQSMLLNQKNISRLLIKIDPRLEVYMFEKFSLVRDLQLELQKNILESNLNSSSEMVDFLKFLKYYPKHKFNIDWKNKLKMLDEFNKLDDNLHREKQNEIHQYHTELENVDFEQCKALQIYLEILNHPQSSTILQILNRSL